MSHRCLKTYYVRDRLGEIRPIVVKAYVVPGLKHDLLSVKALNQSGYRVIYDKDGEESGAFAVINKKIDKSRSFPFMSECSNLSHLKLEQMRATQFEKQSGADGQFFPLFRLFRFPTFWKPLTLNPTPPFIPKTLNPKP